jgi:hypothetical protein
MGLAKKGSRLISIDGVTYRWVVSPDSGYMVLVAELNDEPRQRLEAVFGYDNHPEELGPISPGVVRQVIVAAIHRGWKPSQSGRPPFRLHDTEQLVSINFEPS